MSNSLFVSPGGATDFEVERRPVFVSVNGWDAPQFVPDKHALVRKDTGETLNIVGKKYQVVQNKDFFDTIEHSITEAFPEYEYDIEERVSHGGRISLRDYCFRDISKEIPGELGKLQFRITARNSFGEGAMQAYAGAIDMLCDNQEMWRWDGQHAVRQSIMHTLMAENALERIEGVVRNGIALFDRKLASYQEWAGIELPVAKARQWIDQNFSEYQAKQVKEWHDMETARRGHTLWALHSALTAFSTHGNFKGGDRARASAMMSRQLLTDRLSESPAFAALTRSDEDTVEILPVTAFAAH